MTFHIRLLRLICCLSLANTQEDALLKLVVSLRIALRYDMGLAKAQSGATLMLPGLKKTSNWVGWSGEEFSAYSPECDTNDGLSRKREKK